MHQLWKDSVLFQLIHDYTFNQKTRIWDISSTYLRKHARTTPKNHQLNKSLHIFCLHCGSRLKALGIVITNATQGEFRPGGGIKTIVWGEVWRFMLNLCSFGDCFVGLSWNHGLIMDVRISTSHPGTIKHIFAKDSKSMGTKSSKSLVHPSHWRILCSINRSGF